MELGLSQFRVHGMAWFIVLPPSVACGASLWIWVAGPLESGAPGKPLIFLTFPSSGRWHNQLSTPHSQSVSVTETEDSGERSCQTESPPTPHTPLTHLEENMHKGCPLRCVTHSPVPINCPKRLASPEN